jgi:GTP-binding protein
MDMKPVVALLGRPNVGKSTLFNRLVRGRQALVDDLPGVTRDRHYGESVWNGKPFTVIDTGGFLTGDDDPFAPQIREQVTLAVAQADVLVLILDGRAGLSPYDRDLTDLLRRSGKPVFYLVNKIEHQGQQVHLGEFYSLGIEMFYAVSAEHGIGMDDFLDDLAAGFPDAGELEEPPAEEPVRIAIVGRPNVGKSSLANRLFGSPRVVVNDQAGTTRDAIELTVTRKGQQFVLVDTAGIRRKGRVTQKLEKVSILKSLKSMDDCHVALILIDAAEGITDQDITIAGYAEKKGCGAIFLLNKWDRVDKAEKGERAYISELRQMAKFLSYAPAMTISALTGQRCHRILDMAARVFDEYRFRINTGTLNRIITDAVQREEPSLHKGRRLKFFYATQVAARPPCFVCFVNYPKAVHFSYQRYLINQLRQMIPLHLTPVRLYFREKTGRLDFSDKTREKERITEKKERITLKRKKQRKEQSRKKRQRDGKPGV